MGSSGINAVHGESCSTQLLGKAKYHQTMFPMVTFTLLLSVIMVHVTASPVREGESDGSWHVCVPHNSPQCAFVNSAALRGKRSADSDKGSGGKNRWYPYQVSFGKPDANGNIVGDDQVCRGVSCYQVNGGKKK